MGTRSEKVELTRTPGRIVARKKSIHTLVQYVQVVPVGSSITRGATTRFICVPVKWFELLLFSY